MLGHASARDVPWASLTREDVARLRAGMLDRALRPKTIDGVLSAVRRVVTVALGGTDEDRVRKLFLAEVQNKTEPEALPPVPADGADLATRLLAVGPEEGSLRAALRKMGRPKIGEEREETEVISFRADRVVLDALDALTKELPWGQAENRSFAIRAAVLAASARRGAAGEVVH